MQDTSQESNRSIVKNRKRKYQHTLTNGDDVEEKIEGWKRVIFFTYFDDILGY